MVRVTWGTPLARSGWWRGTWHTPQPGLDGGYPGYPQVWMGYPSPHHHHDWMAYPSPPLDRAAKQALATWWAVCLLRSRRRTFLWTLILTLFFYFIVLYPLNDKQLAIYQLPTSPPIWAHNVIHGQGAPFKLIETDETTLYPVKYLQEGQHPAPLYIV